LSKLASDAGAAERLTSLGSFAFVSERIGGIDCIVATTGYTGAKVAFELLVHPDQACRLWNLILDAGEPLGVVPCGLGARDSLRVEAGLPLYGHELAGRFGISPFEAGYGWAVKLDKTFFIGKAEMARIAETYAMQVVRIEAQAGKGVRPVRQNDPVLDEHGRCIGWVLSCAKAGEAQYALAYVERTAVKEGAAVGLYYLARSPSQVDQGRQESIEKGQTAEPDLTGEVVSRFAKF
jgi:glycine hydroxymethyltransferase